MMHHACHIPGRSAAVLIGELRTEIATYMRATRGVAEESVRFVLYPHVLRAQLLSGNGERN